MGKLQIDKWSLKYWSTKYLWAKNVYRLYYSKIELHNTEVLKQKGPFILAPNHQNALMDAMAIVSSLKFQTVFLARADIFKGKFIVALLTYMKILPVYRIRDGMSSLGKNEEIFDMSTQVLINQNSPLCLFPEGNHGDKRRLRPLVKGIFRIAFKAQSKFGNQPGVKIIPVGIDYSHYLKFQQKLFINFGQPVEVSEFWDLYEQNEAQATNALRDKLAEELQKVMIHIDSEPYYDTIMGLREFSRPLTSGILGLRMNKLVNRFKADKLLIEKLSTCISKEPQVMEEIDSSFKHYSELRDKLNLRDWVLQKPAFSIPANLLVLLFGVLLSPIWLYGYISNWPHYILPPRFAKKIKDTQFRSTANWGLAIVIQLIYYLVLLVLALIFLPAWWMAILLIFTLPFAGIAAYRIRVLFVKTWAKIRYSSILKNTKELSELKTLRSKLVSMLEQVVYK